MGLADLTVQSVEQAMNEFDELGRSAFLDKYGFGPATKYFVIHNGVAYDSKAICGAAHRWASPTGRALRAEDFSGGDKTVAVRLEKLGFAISHSPRRLLVGGPTGTPLRATCELHRLGQGYVITMQSANGGSTPRNPDYKEALRRLLERLAAVGARLDAVVLDFKETRHLPESDRWLLDSAGTKLSPATDVDALAASIGKAAAAISVDPTKKSGGNSTKQIQLRFTAPTLTSLDAVRAQIVLGAVRLFVLTWNPTVFDIPDADMESLIAKTENGDRPQDSWATGSRKTGISPGDHLVLFRQHSDRGMVAHALATSEIWQGEHFNDPSKNANYVSLEWTRWVSTDDRLPVDDLKELAPNTDWNAILGSGIQLHADDASAVLAAWADIAGGAVTPRTGDEDVDGLPEGARKTVTVNRYERNRSARAKCLKVHGTACKVCGIDFGSAYGGLADGFIHVHHIVPIAAIGTEYQLNAVKDLVPVCPNCHAMLHHGVKEPRSVEELRSLLKGSQ